MKTIILNIGENGKVVASDDCLGNSGEHNCTELRIILSDAELLDCEFFRIWFNSRYSTRLYAENGIITYSVPQDALVPPKVRFELAGYRTKDSAVIYATKSEKFIFKVETSHSCRAMNEECIEPSEFLSYEFNNAVETAVAAKTEAVETAEKIEQRLEELSEIDTEVKKGSGNPVSSDAVFDSINWELISSETVEGGTEELKKIDTNYDSKQYIEGVGLLYCGEISVTHPINKGSVSGALYSGLDEENPAGSFTDDGEGNIVTNLSRVVGTVDYEEGKITFSELGMDVPYTFADLTYEWGAPNGVTSYTKDLKGKYKKLCLFITLAYSADYTSNGYINFYANGNANGNKFFNFGAAKLMPTTKGNFTLIKFLTEVVGQKTFSILQYGAETNSTLSGRYGTTSGDLNSAFFPLGADYIETLQIEAVTMALTVGTKIEIYGVKA